MYELTVTQALVLHYVAISSWVLFSSWATYDAVPLWIINRRTFRAYKKTRDRRLGELGALGEVRRSRNFMLAFFLAAVVGYWAFLTDFMYGAEVDTSGASAIILFVLVSHLFFCWRAKHADAVTLKHQRRYIEEDRRRRIERVSGFVSALEKSK